MISQLTTREGNEAGYSRLKLNFRKELKVYEIITRIIKCRIV